MGSGSVSRSESVPDPTISALEADLKKLESLTPAQVRDLLKQKGFTDVDLKDVDDESLMSLYRESLQKALELEKQKQATAQQSPQIPTLGQSTQDPGQLAVQEILNLSKPELLSLLGQTGELTQDQIGELQKLDEAQLKQILLQALQAVQAKSDTTP